MKDLKNSFCELKDKIIIGAVVIYSGLHILNKMSWNSRNLNDRLMAYLTMPWSLI